MGSFKAERLRLTKVFLLFFHLKNRLNVFFKNLGMLIAIFDFFVEWSESLHFSDNF